MENKWRTTIKDADWVYVRYSINPSEVATETLVRKITGIDKSVLRSLIASLRSETTVEDPYADNQKYDGIWTIKRVEPLPDDSSNTAGSASIIEELSYGHDDYANPDNATIARSRAYPVEQNENAWMYYERFKKEETTRWHNMTYAGIVDSQVFDGIRQIFTTSELNAFILAGKDTYHDFFGNTHYYRRRYLYCIVYADKDNEWVEAGRFSNFSKILTKGKYYIPPTATETGKDDSWTFGLNWDEIENPIIRECYYDRQEDGTYNLYRSMETTTNTADMRTRALQYAGMVLVSGLPILDDSVITLKGFLDVDEVIYKNARFRIGSDTYRVLGNETCTEVAGESVGQVTLDITPAITQATEDACDASENQTQIFWDAL